MKYLSTRGGGTPVPFSVAIEKSMSADGGLFVPERFPAFSATDFAGREGLAAIAEKLLEPFVDFPVAPICREAFDFPVPLVRLKDGFAVLELFHGPTAAFKDVGARFLAGCLSREKRKRMVLVATSGDTGGAVAGAFHGRAGFEVAILFPKGKVSPRQEKQLTAWGGNVRAFAVRGDFDDCQRVVKAAFADAKLSAAHGLVSANSINIGRLLPQAAYYAMASLAYPGAGFIIPSGNIGNSVGALWAKAMGFPIREVALATNANRAVADFFGTGRWEPRATVATLANAMDVGNPSNMERVFHLYPDREQLRREVRAVSVSDDEIREEIARGPADWGRIWCPHTATAVRAAAKLGGRDWVFVATAHPAKFDTIVEPLVGKAVPVPENLARILARPSAVTELEPELAALSEAL